MEIEGAFDQAMTILRKLVVDQPRVVEYRSELAGLMMSRGAFYARTGRPDQAEAANEEAIAIRRRLVEDHPDRVDLADDLGLSYYSVAYMKQWKKDYQAAFDWANRAIEVFEASLRREPRRDDIKELLGFAFHARAQALTDQHRADRGPARLGPGDRARSGRGREESPRTHCQSRSGTGVSGRDPARGGRSRGRSQDWPRHRRDLLQRGVHSLTGRGAAANDVASSPEERAALVEQHAAHAISALAEARRAGYFRDASKVANMRSDRDVDPLRSRPDFQELLLDLAFPTDPFAR